MKKLRIASFQLESAPGDKSSNLAMTTLIRSGDFIYCLGGEDQKKHRTAAVWRIACQALLDVSGR